MKPKRVIIAALITAGVTAAAFAIYAVVDIYYSPRVQRVEEFIRHPDNHPNWLIEAKSRCGDAPFVFPTRGYVGFLWDDAWYIGHRHSGLDIFSGKQVGVAPIYAAYDGFLSRLPDWKSTVIIRIPKDPLQPERQIWTYYTHMADPEGNSTVSADFPAGTNEVFVRAGTLLGYQGNFSGTPGSPVGVHLHFSIVKDDGKGKFLNETRIENTLDPSPYLGLNVNVHNNPAEIPLCEN